MSGGAPIRLSISAKPKPESGRRGAPSWTRNNALADQDTPQDDDAPGEQQPPPPKPAGIQIGFKSAGSSSAAGSGFKKTTDFRKDAASRLGFEAGSHSGSESGSRPAQPRKGDATAISKLLDDGRDDMEEQETTSKPTLRLRNLPPGIGIQAIRNLFPATLKVEAIRFEETVGREQLPARQLPAYSERKSVSVIATVSYDTPVSEIESAVSLLQGRYLGCGYFLNISRHLSTAALGLSGTGSGLAISSGLLSATGLLPFGAKPIKQRFQGPHGSFNRHAPPPSLTGKSYSLNNQLQMAPAALPKSSVQVRVPTSLSRLRMIHQTVEAVLEHGPQFEALLMRRPEVQKDEKWAWIWDPRSPDGVYYRWKIWTIKAKKKFTPGERCTVIEGLGPWIAPRAPPFEFVDDISELVEHDDYVSSGDEMSDHEHGRARSGSGSPRRPRSADSHSSTEKLEAPLYLTPFNKARLVHLLARLPPTTSALTQGDVARVTAFCIAFARVGVEEIVDLVVSNVEHPFHFTSARNAHWSDPAGDPDRMDDIQAESGGARPSSIPDRSSAHLVGLQVLSDIISASSASDVPGAWKFRSAFEHELRRRHVFAQLSGLDGHYGWGRIKLERWRRSVDGLLKLWTDLSAFSPEGATQMADEFFRRSEAKAGAEDDGRGAAATAATTDELVREAVKAPSRWKTVVGPAAPETPVRSGTGSEPGASVAECEGADAGRAGADEEDVDGEPMEEDPDDEYADAGVWRGPEGAAEMEMGNSDGGDDDDDDDDDNDDNDLDGVPYVDSDEEVLTQTQAQMQMQNPMRRPLVQQARAGLSRAADVAGAAADGDCDGASEGAADPAESLPGQASAGGAGSAGAGAGAGVAGDGGDDDGHYCRGGNVIDPTAAAAITTTVTATEKVDEFVPPPPDEDRDCLNTEINNPPFLPETTTIETGQQQPQQQQRRHRARPRAEDWFGL